MPGNAPNLASTPTRMELSVLGGFTARVDDVAVTLPTRKARALVAYLALAPQNSCDREKLSGVFWCETGKEQGLQSLRQTLFTIRKALPQNVAPVLVANARTVTLDPARIRVDAVELESRLRDPTLENLEQVAALYRGELLDGCSLNEPVFEAWLTSERSRLCELIVSALDRLAELQAEAGAVESAIQTCLRLQRMDPWAEANTRALMRLYVKQGRRASALAHYQAFARALEKELGVLPERATRALYDDISALGDALPAPLATTATCMANRPATRLIGRDAELASLRAALGAGWSHSAPIAVLVGEAGVGKTRLLDELAAHAIELGGRIVRGRAFESEQVLPFAVWVDALRADGALVHGPAFDELPESWRAELSRLYPGGGAASVSTPSPNNVARLFEAITGLLGRAAERTPLLVLLDDLQWADDLSLRLLAFAARRRSARCRIFIAATVRKEELARATFLPTLLRELSRERLSVTTEVRPLSEQDTRLLVRSLARPDQALDEPDLFQQIWTVSEGNPFVVLESVRAVAEGTLGRGVSQLSVPERVREVVAGHVARLAPLERDLSAIASVIGRNFDFALLQVASGQDGVVVASAVEELVHAGVFREEEGTFYFTHDRIREVVYAGLLVQRRTVLHGCVARALEALHGAEVDAVSSQLAFHYARANEPAAAVDYLTRFAENAARAFGLEEALVALSEASLLTERIPASERARWRVEIAVRKANCLGYLGRFAEIEPCLSQHQSSLEELNRLELTSQFHFWLGFTHSLVGDRAAAAHHIQLALDGAESCGDARTMRRAHALLSYELSYAGRFEQGLEHGFKATEKPAGGEPEYVALGWMNVGCNYQCMGRLPPAIDAFAKAGEIARSAGIPRVEALVLGLSGLALCQLGEKESALDTGRRAVATACDPVSTMATSSMLGHVLVACGLADEALEILPDVVSMASRFGMRSSEAHAQISTAEAYLSKGDIETATRFAESGVAIARLAGERRNIGRALVVSARCAAPRGDYELAAVQLSEAKAMLEAIGAGFDLGTCLCALGELAYERNDRINAAEFFSEAEALYRRLSLSGPAARAAESRRAVEFAKPR
jgi:DNA-binding SARP family transcriptional activator